MIFKKWNKKSGILTKDSFTSLKKENSSIDKIDLQSKTKSLISTLEEYERKLESDYNTLPQETQLETFPELFQIRNVENDKDSTVPILVISRPLRIFTALYEANFKSMLEKERKRSFN